MNLGDTWGDFKEVAECEHDTVDGDEKNKS